jgi:peptidyl-prolyl cis-trans isomerase SurA
MMKSFYRSVFVMMCGLLLATTSIAANEQSLDGIVATVNDGVITQSELDHAMNLVKKQMSASNEAPPAPSVLRKKVLEQIVNRKLQLQVAEQAGIKASDAQVNQAIERIATGNKITVAALYQTVAQQGLTVEAYRKEIREEITLQQLQQAEVGSKVNVTPDEVKQFMHSKAWQTNANTGTAESEYRIDDILLTLPDNASATEKQTVKNHATDILNKLRQGMTLKAAANGNASSLQDNDLGWRKLSEIPSAFTDTVSSMKSHEFAGPVETSNGFHIIRLVAVRSVGNNTSNVAAPDEKEAGNIVYQRKLDAALEKWLAKLRSEAVINLNPEG